MGFVGAKIMEYEGVWLTRGMGYEGVDCNIIIKGSDISHVT